MSTIFTNNADDPNSPEFGKKWKENQNFGCCPSCKELPPPICSTVVSGFTRFSQDPSLAFQIDHVGTCPCQRNFPVIDICSEDISTDNTCK